MTEPGGLDDFREHSHAESEARDIAWIIEQIQIDVWRHRGVGRNESHVAA